MVCDLVCSIASDRYRHGWSVLDSSALSRGCVVEVHGHLVSLCCASKRGANVCPLVERNACGVEQMHAVPFVATPEAQLTVRCPEPIAIIIIAGRTMSHDGVMPAIVVRRVNPCVEG